MDEEQQKDKIVEIVKKAISENSLYDYDKESDEVIAQIDGDDVDHIAEEVAENITFITLLMKLLNTNPMRIGGFPITVMKSEALQGLLKNSKTSATSITRKPTDCKRTSRKFL